MLKSRTIVELFDNMKEANGAIAELKNAGISGSDIKSLDRNDVTGHLEGEASTGMLNLLKGLFGADYRMEFEDESSLYGDFVRKGGVLLAVNTDDNSIGTARRILESYGVEEVTERVAEVKPQRVAADPIPLRSETGKDDRIMEVIEEELHVGKRKVQKGAIRVVKHVKETPVEQTVNLRDETVTISRRPLDRIANEKDLNELTDTTIEMIETAEEAVVMKEPHVREEITISRKVVDHQETIRDKVKKTEVDIEGLEPRRLRDVEFRKDFAARFGSTGRNFSDYSPAYELGSTMALEERFRNRNWAEIESDARKQWESGRPGSWKDVVDAVRHGWEKARGKVA